MIKILPAKAASSLKLLYVSNTEGRVEVKFYGSKGLIMKDRIKPKDFKEGFVRNYDLSGFEAGTYAVEIIAEGMSVRYELAISPDQQLWARACTGDLAEGQAIASK